MSTILDKIVATKRAEIAAARQARPTSELEKALAKASPVRGFASNLLRTAGQRPGIIAEIKRGSPSLGSLRPDLDAPGTAARYAEGGAACLSVLTDADYFHARPADFAEVRARVTLPMLRKDFMVDDYQILQSRAMGADCILLIMACLDDKTAARLGRLAHDLGMDVLCETHDAGEIARALEHVPFDLLGINNRNLKTFATSVEVTLELADKVPDRTKLVAESGLHDPATIRRLWEEKIRLFLIGEAFVRSENPAETVRSFCSL